MNQAESKYFEDKFECIDNRLKKIYRGIYGDKSDDFNGLLDKQQSNEQRFQAIEEKHKVAVVWIIRIMVSVIGAIVLLLINLLIATL